MIHIYYGFGKGKTTAALGLGMRAYGAGKSIALVQFLKDNRSSELSVLPFTVYPAPSSLSFHPDESYQLWIDGALDFINNTKADVLLLDEFLDVIPDFVSEEQALALMNKAGKEIVITGHQELPSLFDKADYITFMDKIRHPYDKGIKARRGIEY